MYPGTVLFQLSSTVYWFGPGLQTSASNCFIVAALTADGSPKVVVAEAVAPGLALGVAVAAGDVVAFAVVLVVALADAVPVGVAVGLASLAETSEVDAFAVALGGRR